MNDTEIFNLTLSSGFMDPVSSVAISPTSLFSSTPADSVIRGILVTTVLSTIKNTTSARIVVATTAFDPLKFTEYVLYIITSFLAMMSSTMICYVIYKRKELHTKDFYLIAGLSSEISPIYRKIFHGLQSNLY